MDSFPLAWRSGLMLPAFAGRSVVATVSAAVLQSSRIPHGWAKSKEKTTSRWQLTPTKYFSAKWSIVTARPDADRAVFAAPSPSLSYVLVQGDKAEQGLNRFSVKPSETLVGPALCHARASIISSTPMAHQTSGSMAPTIAMLETNPGDQ
jgi:hypothetical protein